MYLVSRQTKTRDHFSFKAQERNVGSAKNIWLPWVAPYSACSVTRQSALPNMDVIRDFSRDLAMQAEAEHFGFK
ncbi:hypothetical protein [Hoeflea sp.]|uniref:hypothetical protein n=1 Tax=Hoeflea sp. TaxID=1940281 RepID=UPI00374982D6